MSGVVGVVGGVNLWTSGLVANVGEESGGLRLRRELRIAEG